MRAPAGDGGSCWGGSVQLPTDLDARPTASDGANEAATATAGTSGTRCGWCRNELDPQRILAFVVRGGIGLAKCIQAALLRTRCRGSESRQLEDHPGAIVELAHA